MSTYSFRPVNQDTHEYFEGCPILRQIYAWHCIVLTSDNNTLQKHNNKERSKTIRNLTMPCITFSEYWTSINILAPFRVAVVIPRACFRCIVNLIHLSVPCDGIFWCYVTWLSSNKRKGKHTTQSCGTYKCPM